MKKIEGIDLKILVEQCEIELKNKNCCNFRVKPKAQLAEEQKRYDHIQMTCGRSRKTWRR